MIIFNFGEVVAIPSIVIPSLIGLSTNLNPNETVHFTASETSWLCELFEESSDFYFAVCKEELINICVWIIPASFLHIAHPIGSLLSGPMCDSIGRRKAMMLISIPLFFAWVMLGFAQSFPIICFGFVLLGFCMGLKEAPVKIYVSEIRWLWTVASNLDN